MNGIVNVNKPQNYTSHDCVAIMRRVTGIKKIGHTGTLDPMATGVLPICIGKATRIMEYLDLDYKTYIATLQLGIETDTLDVWGEIINKREVNSTEEEAIKAVMTFTGEVEQIPPKYSALKVNGKKLYEYAREGKDIEIKSRKIFVDKIEVLDVKLPYITFSVTCSKGTYIRSLCRDIGEKLGCGGAMSALERVESGIFNISKSISIEEIKKMTKEDVKKLICPMDYSLTHFGKATMGEETAKDFINGKHIPLCQVHIEEECKSKKMYKLYCKNIFIGVAYYSEEYNKLVADKVFNTEIKNENI